MPSTMLAKWLTEVGFAVAQQRQQGAANTYVCAGFSEQRQSSSTGIFKHTKCVLNDQTLYSVFVIMIEVALDKSSFQLENLVLC